MEKLRIGIIGTGNISNCHMEGYTAIPDLVEVVACCDLDQKKMDAWAERWGVKNKYTDYNEMLAKENLHVVSVCIWNAAHKAPTVAALKAGKKLDAHRTGGAHNSYSGIFVHCLMFCIVWFCRPQPLRLTRGRYYTHL